MGTVREGWKAIASHLHKGSVWARLKLVATASVDYGGLALFVEGSPGYAAVFSKAPPTVIDTRPQTDQEMAEWLVPRMHVLSRLIEHDRQRARASLNDEDVEESKAAQLSRQSFADEAFRIRVPICAEVLRRALYLHRWANAHPYVAARTSLPSLFDKALTLVTDVATVDDEFLAVNRLQRATLLARGWTELGWVEVAVRQCLHPDARRCADVLPDMLAFHLSVATNIAAHLQLVFTNVIRTSWLAGELLATNPADAQRAACELHGKLIRSDEAQRTSFEKAFIDDGRLELLASFASRAVPVVLWRGGGDYAKLYRWLAVRFLGNVDNVLECESVHAQWQWIETVAHAIKLKQLNAVLLLRSWLQHHCQLPGHDALQPYLPRSDRRRGPSPLQHRSRGRPRRGRSSSRTAVPRSLQLAGNRRCRPRRPSLHTDHREEPDAFVHELLQECVQAWLLLQRRRPAPVVVAVRSANKGAGWARPRVGRGRRSGEAFVRRLL